MLTNKTKQKLDQPDYQIVYVQNLHHVENYWGGDQLLLPTLIGYITISSSLSRLNHALGRECLAGNMEIEHSFKLLDIALQPFLVR